MPPINVAGFNVKETPYREYGGTQDLVNAQLQNRRFEYQRQKEQEANLYRDLDIIGEGTSLKGRLTGVPEINRVYEKLTEGVLNDLVNKAGKIPITDLYGEMTKKMTPIFQGLEAATNDVKVGTELANNITGQVKQLDKGALMSDITDRVKLNYLNPDGTHKDVNTLRPTDYSDILNPNYLTKYATGTDALTNAFSADKGTDLDWKIKHPNGGEQTFRAKVPEYIQPSVNPEELIKNNLFVPKGQTMGFQVKGDEENGVKLFDKGLMSKYLNDLPTQIAFNKAFKEAHPEDLSRLTPIQLENLQRAFLADYAKKGFSIHDAGTYHPPRYSSTTNVYGSGGSGDIKGNEFDRITYDAGGVDVTEGKATIKADGTPYSGNIRVVGRLIPAQVKAILKSAGTDVKDEEYFNLKYKNGRLESMAGENDASIIDRTDMENAQRKWNTENAKAVQPKFGERENKPKGVSYSWNGHNYTEQEIADNAKESGMSIQEYIKKAGIKKN